MALRRAALLLAYVAATGWVLRQAIGVEPVWWIAWVAPIPLLLLAFSLPLWQSRTAVLLAVSIATSVYVRPFSLVMPPLALMVALLALTLLWVAIVMTTRRIVLAHRGGWVVFVYPLLWVTADLLLATLHPDGNWGALAYSQSDVLPVVQIVSLFGLSGLLFLLCLLPSTVAVLLWHREHLQYRNATCAVVAVIFAAALGYGVLRLRTPLPGTPTRIAAASIDDAIEPNATAAYSTRILAGYDALVARAAGEGATVVVLPEKVAVLKPEAAAGWEAHFAGLAARHRVWLEVGIGIAESPRLRNYAWLFDPVGRRVQQYEKHFLAPPERAQRYAHGTEFHLQDIAGIRYGLAICKDMHFARLGRDNGLRDAGALLVPAWDFAYVDAWMGARMTMVRGVENGYAVIRAAREGLLTVSDAHGRVIAEVRSAELPGSILVTDVVISPRLQNWYTRVGDVFGWVGVALTALMFWLHFFGGRRRS